MRSLLLLDDGRDFETLCASKLYVGPGVTAHADRSTRVSNEPMT
jgi:hypothetical protein